MKNKIVFVMLSAVEKNHFGKREIPRFRFHCRATGVSGHAKTHSCQVELVELIMELEHKYFSDNCKII